MSTIPDLRVPDDNNNGNNNNDNNNDNDNDDDDDDDNDNDDDNDGGRPARCSCTDIWNISGCPSASLSSVTSISSLLLQPLFKYAPVCFVPSVVSSLLLPMCNVKCVYMYEYTYV